MILPKVWTKWNIKMENF